MTPKFPYILTTLIMIVFTLNSLAKEQDSTTYKVRSIQIYGNKQIRESSLNKSLSITALNRNDSTKVSKLIHSIFEQYSASGHQFIEIDSVLIQFDDEMEETDVNIYIDEIEKIEVDSLIIATADSTKLSDLNAFVDYRNRDDIEYMFINTIEKILDHLENNGYPFARIKIDSLFIKQNFKIHAFMTVIPGPFMTIDVVSIHGNKVTRDNVIIREARVKPGDVYRHTGVVKITNRLEKLGFFENVYEPQIFINSNGEGELVINVDEGNMNNFDGVVGYNPGQTNQKGYFTGLIDITLANFMGTGRRIEAYWEKKTQKTQQLRFRYQEPWLLGYPLHMGGSFEQLIQDTSFIRREWKLDLQIPFTETIQLFAAVGNESISPDSIGSILYQIPRSTSQLALAGIAFDTRDDRINPSKGFYYRTEVEVAQKNVDALSFATDLVQQGSFTRRKMSMDIEMYITTFKYQVASFAFHGKQVKSTEKTISISDMFRFGGSNTMRGFREDEFLGERVAWLNSEYRYLLSPGSRAFLFVDTGYFFRKDLNNVTIDDIKFGYGFGLRLDTRLGLMGIDYGLAKGRSLTNGLIHVRLINTF